MISYLQGNIIFRGKDFVVLDVGGVGYKVFLPEKTLSKLAKKESACKLYTFLRWREDAVELYGFLTYAELELFEAINDISGVGPRTALALSSFGSLEKLKTMLEEGKIAIKGIGRKKLQKIALEITGKIKGMNRDKSVADKEKDEDIDALVSLGFSRQAAKSALGGVPPEIQDHDQRVKEALKLLGK